MSIEDLLSDKWIFKLKEEKVEKEFGSSENVRWLSPENVTVYDEDGNEIEIKCDKCGSKEGVTTFMGITECFNICHVCMEKNIEKED